MLRIAGTALLAFLAVGCAKKVKKDPDEAECQIASRHEMALMTTAGTVEMWQAGTPDKKMLALNRYAARMAPPSREVVDRCKTTYPPAFRACLREAYDIDKLWECRKQHLGATDVVLAPGLDAGPR